MQNSNKTLGIILAGGKSSRLYPATLATTKQLLPVYDKPMIYYPLSTLMLAGVKDVVIITTPEEQQTFIKLLGFGKEFGMKFKYMSQSKPAGIAQAFHIVGGKEKLTIETFDSIQDKEPIVVSDYTSTFLILGDNIIYGSGLTKILRNATRIASDSSVATTFFQRVPDPERFGVGLFDKHGYLIKIDEKPKQPKGNLISIGAYVYPCGYRLDDMGYANYTHSVFNFAKKLKKSDRGEYEITDLNNLYLDDGRMVGEKLPRGTSWFDCGTYDSLLEASEFVKNVQKHQASLVCSPHEIAFNQKWVDRKTIEKFIDSTGGATKNSYNAYLNEICR